MTKHPNWDLRKAQQATTIPQPSQKIQHQAVRIRPWVGGLNREETPDALDSKQTPFARDTYHFLGEVRKTHGSHQIGGDFANKVYWSGVWQREDGTFLPVAIDSGGLYYWNAAAWVAVTGTAFAGFTIGLAAIERFVVRFWNDVMYFASDNNALRSWDGNPANNHAAVAGGFTTRGMMVLNNHLILAATRNAGTLESQTYRFTQSGTASFAGTGSGTYDLSDSEGVIENVASLGPFRGLAYKSDSIVDIRATGDIGNVFENTELVPGVGILLPYSLVPYSGGHFFVGTDEQIYFYNGSALESIGDEIRTAFFNTIYQQRPRDAVATVNRNQQEYMIFLPEGQLGYCKSYWAYNYIKKTWRYGEYNKVIHVNESRSAIKGPVASGFVGPTTNTVSSISVFSLSPPGPSRWQTLLTTDTKRVLRLVDAGLSFASFDGTALDFEKQTIDFISDEDGKELTLKEVRIAYIAGDATAYIGLSATTTLTVDYSNDGGNTWGNSEDVVLSQGKTKYTLQYAYSTQVITAHKIRARVRNAIDTQIIRLLGITLVFLNAEEDRPEAAL